jgi:hypothetical protein
MEYHGKWQVGFGLTEMNLRDIRDNGTMGPVCIVAT